MFPAPFVLHEVAVATGTFSHLTLDTKVYTYRLTKVAVNVSHGNSSTEI